MLVRDAPSDAPAGQAPFPDARCLIVTNKFPPTIGGAGAIYAALARASAGHIHVLCAWRDYASGAPVPGWREHDAACGASVHRIRDIRPALHRRPGALPRLRRWLWEEPAIRVRLLARVALLCRRHRFSAVCIADDETVGWLIRPVQRLLGCRAILYCHGDDLAERPGEARLRARRRRQFAWADAIVASSAAAAGDLGRVFGVKRARVTIISNGVDTARYRPLPPDPALAAALGLAGQRVVATVSRLVPRKGIDTVIAALPALRRDFGALRYLVVGDGPDRDRLQRLAETLGVADAVVFAGAVPADDVPRHLALAELMIMANRQEADGEDEGTPLVFLEASACGKPVIAGRTGGAPDLVADGETGLCIDGSDTQAVADALRRMLADPAWARRLGAAGLARAQAATWESLARSFAKLFRAPG